MTTVQGKLCKSEVDLINDWNQPRKSLQNTLSILSEKVNENLRAVKQYNKAIIIAIINLQSILA